MECKNVWLAIWRRIQNRLWPAKAEKVTVTNERKRSPSPANALLVGVVKGEGLLWRFRDLSQTLFIL